MSRQSQITAKDLGVSVGYYTDAGVMFRGSAEDVLESLEPTYSGKVNLILTSPPFPLNHKKAYGNLTGQAYLDWLAGLAPVLRRFLTPDGSIVVELGNAWEPGKPVMSILPLNSLLSFLNGGKLHLCQQFVCYNPARLPSPAQWVNVERIRVKDSFTHVWWMSPSPRPKADNRRVLTEYSPAMRRLLKTKKYNGGQRPSEHNIGEKSFLTNNNGAIPPNVLMFANTDSKSRYQRYCRENGLKPHPARMAPGLVRFFIDFLTEPGDLVLDPFGGSNTTGAVAEEKSRSWISIEARDDYIKSSIGRFDQVRKYKWTLAATAS